MWKTIDEYCFRAKNLYNYTNYILRHEFIEKKFISSAYDLDKSIQNSEPYTQLGSQAAQKTIELLCKNWKSFFKAIKDYSKNPSKYLGKPKLPKYKDKNGRSILMIKNIQCRIENNILVFSWKPFRSFKIPTKVTGKLMQVRFIPNGNNYTMEIVYQIEIPEPKEKNNRIVGIDLGVDNFATVSNNVGLKPFIVNGRGIKSINQYYNKKLSKIRSELKTKNNKEWSNRLDRFAQKRNSKVEYFLHCASKLVAEYCVKNNIDAVVVGYNQEWKQEVNLSKKTNQNFVYIPFYEFISKLKYKLENFGIKFITTNESYTSGTSFLDGEEPTKDNYNKKRRIKRGLFKSNNGVLINSDLNGSYQIIKKVFPNAFEQWDRGWDLHPVRLNIGLANNIERFL